MAERKQVEDAHKEGGEQTVEFREPSGGAGRTADGGIRTPTSRSTMGSVVSPSLSTLAQDNAETTSLPDSNSSKKKKKKKKKGISKAAKEEEGYEETSTNSKESREDTLAMLLNMTLELQSQIRTMQEDRPASSVNRQVDEKYRRDSIAVVSKEAVNNVVRALVPVPEEEKTKKASVYAIIDLQTKMNELMNQGIHTSIINYLSKSVLQKILLWLSLGNCQEAGLYGYDFVTIEDLNKLSESDIESILILMIRPNEKGMLIKIMKDVRVFVSQHSINVSRPLYLQLKTIFQAVLEYLHTYEKIYKMMSGEIGMLVNGVVIGENANTCIDTMSKIQSDAKNPETHDAILKLTLVHGEIIPLRLYNLIKGDPARGPGALVLKTAEMIEKLHPRRAESNGTSGPAIVKPVGKNPTHPYHTHLCRYPGVKVEFGKVLLETMRHNLNIAVSVHDGVIQPFLAMMMPDVGTSKAGRTVNMLGALLTMDEGCDEREGILESLENTGNDGEHVQHCCFLEDELAKAKEVARESELKCQELTAAEHSRIYNLVNGSAPVKIPTGFQNQHRTNATSSKTILKRSDKPCFAEAKARGSCTRGSLCRYSHLEKDLEELRRNPVAASNLHVLGELEGIPAAYDAAAESFSEQY